MAVPRSAERLVVAVEDPVLREVVEVPVLRLVERFWSTLPVERVVEPVLRLVVAEVEPEERLVVPFWVAVLRLVRSFWVAVPVERVAVEELPVLRLVVAEVELPLERLVVPLWVEVPRLVRSVWTVGLAERVAVEELPVLRLVVAEVELPLERLVVPLLVERLPVLEPVLRVRSFCAKEERLADAPAEWLIELPVERLMEGLEERVAPIEAPEEREGATEPDERLIEEDPRVVVWEEDDRAAEDPPERRDWASASGAATITKVRAIAAKVLIILFMALSF